MQKRDGAHLFLKPFSVLTGGRIGKTSALPALQKHDFPSLSCGSPSGAQVKKGSFLTHRFHPADGRDETAIIVSLLRRWLETFFGLAPTVHRGRTSFSKPPPLGEVARLAVTEGVRLIHPTDCKDNRRIFRGGRCRKDRQSDRAVALTALPLLLRFCGSRISPFPVKTARFGQNPFPFSPFCRHAGFFFLLFPAPFLPAFCILPSLVSCFCAGFFPCGSAVLLFYIFV